MNYGELLKACKLCTISVSEKEAKVVESKTRLKSKSPLWFKMKTGRIIASLFKSAARTSLN